MSTKLLDTKGWKSPNAVCNLFASLPRSPGLYVLVRPESVPSKTSRSRQTIILHILYIGMSENLAQRFLNHHVKNHLDQKGEYAQIWFKRCPRALLRTRERKLIKKYDPPYNVIHRRWGEDG